MRRKEQVPQPDISLSTLKTRFRTLWKVRKQLQSQMGRTSWQKEALHYSAAVEYGRLSCIALCQKIYKVLPLELREKIYAELVGSGDYEIIPVHLPKNQYRGADPSLVFSILSKSSGSSTHEAAEHWWYETYTGANVDREIATTWYRTRTFRLTTEDRRYSPGFFTTDPTGKVLAPSQEIQRVEFLVGEPTSDLEILFEIQNTNAELIISLYGENMCLLSQYQRLSKDVWPLLKGVAPVVYRLRAAGYCRVMVQVRIPHWGGVVRHDVTYLFDMSEKDLEENGQELLSRITLDMYSEEYESTTGPAFKELYLIQ